MLPSLTQESVPDQDRPARPPDARPPDALPPHALPQDDRRAGRQAARRAAAGRPRRRTSAPQDAEPPDARPPDVRAGGLTLPPDHAPPEAQSARWTQPLGDRVGRRGRMEGVPEGDTVWLAARRMNEALAGRVLTRFDLRVPRHAIADLTGRRVIEVVPRGKHMLTRIEGGVTLHTHFRMDGTWQLGRPGSRWRGPAHEVRAVLANAEWQAVGFRLHDVLLLPTSEEHRVVGHLGPDLLGPDWDAAEAVRRLESQLERSIGEALLDQRNVAGIGTLYRAEALFLRGVNPWTPVGEVTDPVRLLELARKLMIANRDHQEQITTGDRRRGRQHWVYGRGGEACRRCGTRVLRDSQGPAGEERVTYWCPHCQPAQPTQPARSDATKPAPTQPARNDPTQPARNDPTQPAPTQPAPAQNAATHPAKTNRARNPSRPVVDPGRRRSS